MIGTFTKERLERELTQSELVELRERNMRASAYIERKRNERELHHRKMAIIEIACAIAVLSISIGLYVIL